MLRITINETPTENRWILQGRLVGLWVSEMRRSWKETHRTHNHRKCVVDLNEVTFIDKKGERLLRAMSKEGAQFIATGIYIKDVLDQLKPSSKHGLLKVISCLFATLLGGVIAPPLLYASEPGTPETDAVQGSTVELHSTNQRRGITAASFLLKSKKEQHRAS